MADTKDSSEPAFITQREKETNMSDTIVDTEELCDGMDYEESMEQSDLAATKAPADEGMQFFVQMKGYTLADFDDMVVEAAARLLVGKHRDADIAKRIEERCIELVQGAADKKLVSVTKEIMDQPVTTHFPGTKQSEPVTMRDFIGLTGREYLAEKVGSNGKVPTDSWGRHDMKPRLEWIVESAMRRDFKNEIEKATTAAIAEVQKEVRSLHAAMIEAEKARFRKALDKLSAPGGGK